MARAKKITETEPTQAAEAAVFMPETMSMTEPEQPAEPAQEREEYISQHTAEEIDKSVDIAHEHKNKAVLDKFGESEGQPTFGGKPIEGKQGEPGIAATIQIGTVATGEPGSVAQVINVGTPNKAIFDFVIPQGLPGGGGGESDIAWLPNVDENGIISWQRSSSTISPEPRNIQGKDGNDGLDGKSAYQIWLDQGNVGTEQDFISSLRGADGQDGVNGTDGIDGADGFSPTITVKTKTPTEYVLTITTADKTFDTPNLQGQDLGGGEDGYNGWSPIVANVPDDDRVVQRIQDWIGGTGTKPTTGQYIGETGLVNDIAQAKDIRGLQGIQGERGEQGIQGETGLQGERGADATINGENVLEIIDSPTVVVDISDGQMQFHATGTSPVVLYLAHKDGRAVFTQEKPTVNQVIFDRIWRPAIWGEWTEIGTIDIDPELLRQEPEIIIGSIVTSKLWISSDIAVPNVQFQLSITDKTDGTELVAAFDEINLNNTNTLLTPATLINKFRVSRQISIKQLQITLSFMTTAPGTQFGIVSNVPAQMSFATITAATVAGGGSIPSQYIDVTYAELKAKITANQLTQSQWYRIADYATKYRQPYTNVIKTSAVESLIVQAISTSQLAVIAYSEQYPQDIIYYDINDKYCEDGTLNASTGYFDGGTPRNGFIQRRIDTKHGPNHAHDWRTMLWARFKANGIPWTSGMSITQLSMYESGGGLYQALRAGTPTAITDANYFTKICNTTDYYWAVTRTGLTLNTTDYAECYKYNATTDLTVKTPVRSDTIFPEGNYSGYPSLKSHTGVKGLDNIVYRFNTEANKPKGNNSGDYNFSNTITGSYNKQGNYNANSIINGDAFLQGNYNYGSIIKGNYNSQGIYNYDSTILGDSNSQGNYNHSSTILGGRNSQGNGNQASTIIGGGNSQGNYNNNFITGTNFNYNVIENGVVASKNVSAIPELHGKQYPHRLTKNAAGESYAIHLVGTTQTFTAIP